MIKYLEKKFALTEAGAKDLIKACLACTISYFVLSIPIGLLYLVVSELLGPIVGLDTKSYSLFNYIIGIILLFVLIYIAHYIEYNARFLSTYKESGKRRTNLAEKLRKLPLSFFGKKDATDLTTTIMSDCTGLEHGFSHWLPNFVGSILYTSIICIVLFAIDFKMAFATTWCVPVSFLIILLAKKIIRAAESNRIQDKLVASDGIQECIEMIRDLKSNNADEDYINHLEKKIKKAEVSTRKNELTAALFVTLAQMVLKIGIGTVGVVGSSLFIAGNLDVLTFMLFLIIASRLYDPLSGTLVNLTAIVNMQPKIDRMNEIYDCKIQAGSTNFNPSNYDITFKDVSFAYNQDNQILEHVSFIAKQGEVTALVGPSGGGKSTTAKLAARFWDVTNGTVEVGGINIATIDPETLLSCYAIVFQDITLFNTSILENIRLGRKGASDEEVIAAAKKAMCDDFVSKLPNGYDTIIGENGALLSGGERQRISIARAVLKDAPIILLDEATASLDVENETKVQEAISRLIKNKTVLMIAHRMRIVAGADRIVVVKDGVVSEQGSPTELINKDGLYKHMIEVQARGTDWKI